MLALRFNRGATLAKSVGRLRVPMRSTRSFVLCSTGRGNMKAVDTKRKSFVLPVPVLTLSLMATSLSMISQCEDEKDPTEEELQKEWDSFLAKSIIPGEDDDDDDDDDEEEEEDDDDEEKNTEEIQEEENENENEKEVEEGVQDDIATEDEEGENEVEELSPEPSVETIVLTSDKQPTNGKDLDKGGFDPVQNEIDRAIALMSTWGTCRSSGDAYLACVASSGLGMCKPLRNLFEGCTNSTYNQSSANFRKMCESVCADEQTEQEMLLCGARFLLRQRAL